MFLYRENDEDEGGVTLGETGLLLSRGPSSVVWFNQYWNPETPPSPLLFVPSSASALDSIAANQEQKSEREKDAFLTSTRATVIEMCSNSTPPARAQTIPSTTPHLPVLEDNSRSEKYCSVLAGSANTWRNLLARTTREDCIRIAKVQAKGMEGREKRSDEQCLGAGMRGNTTRRRGAGSISTNVSQGPSTRGRGSLMTRHYNVPFHYTILTAIVVINAT